MRRVLISCAVCVFAALLATAALAAPQEGSAGRVNVLLDCEGALSGETALGNAAADALRLAAGADIAIVPGGELRAAIPAGEVTWAKLAQVFADTELAAAYVTPAQLKAVLEAGLSHICLDLSDGDRIDREGSAFAGFPQTSGLRFKYDASALPGSRVLSVELGGETLELTDGETRFLLVSTRELLSGGFGGPALSGVSALDFTLSEAFAERLAQLPQGLDKPETRMKVIGSGDDALVAHVIPSRAIAVLVLVFVLCFGVVKSSRGLRNKDELD